MKCKYFYIFTMFCLLLLSTVSYAQIETITSTVRQPFGGSQSPDDARIAAFAKAKREALEQAGIYLESLTIVKNSVLEKDEIFALTAGVLKAEIVSQKNYATADAFGIVIVAKVDVDTSILEERVSKLLKDRTLLKKYQDAQEREKDLLVKIKSLEEKDKKLQGSFSNEDKDRLKEEFRKTSNQLTATELNEKALALWDNGFYTDVIKAIEYLKDAIRLDPDYGEAYNNIGMAYDSKGEYDRAIEYYQKALEIGIKKLGPEHPSVATRYNNIGLAYNSKGEYDRAIEYLQKALKIDIKKLGPEHPNVAVVYNNIGEAYRSKGEYDRAIEYYQKSLKINLKKLGPEHPDTAINYNNIGSAYHYKGEYDRAIGYFQKALKICIKRLGKNHPYTKIVQRNLNSVK
ncbi:MAG: tetratricopeptide repeat protein [Desulfobacteraceae bacterium]|nr:tetratricopeptide repeat protein [Pseudomonadota bacterium]MCG2754118.1 tetratricopeptide repeat protein [Desulfobacteraceae bacterium]